MKACQQVSISASQSLRGILQRESFAAISPVHRIKIASDEASERELAMTKKKDQKI